MNIDPSQVVRLALLVIIFGIILLALTFIIPILVPLAVILIIAFILFRLLGKKV